MSATPSASAALKMDQATTDVGGGAAQTGDRARSGRGAASPGGVPGWLARIDFTPLRSFAILLLVWQGVAVWTASPIQLPTPLRVGAAFLDLAAEGEITEHALVSVTRLVVSLAIAVVLAVPLGFLMGLNRKIDAFVDPLIELLRPISGIAWIPLALFIFGIGDVLPVFIMVYVAFFALLLNTISGVRSVDPKLIAAARTMGVARPMILAKVVAPAALPAIVVGFRLAFAGAWAAIVAAELIGAPNGLGFAIEWYRELLMSPKVFAFILVIAVIGYVCDLGLRALQRRLTPWVDEAGHSS
ncbi:MAG: ABC transporter permease [Hyphomicrobiales bacterium]|nr:ABC transporter permease [Hyphomicrobiales bacterium]